MTSYIGDSGVVSGLVTFSQAPTNSLLTLRQSEYRSETWIEMDLKTQINTRKLIVQFPFESNHDPNEFSMRQSNNSLASADLST